MPTPRPTRGRASARRLSHRGPVAAQPPTRATPALQHRRRSDRHHPPPPARVRPSALCTAAPAIPPAIRRLGAGARRAPRTAAHFLTPPSSAHYLEAVSSFRNGLEKRRLSDAGV